MLLKFLNIFKKMDWLLLAVVFLLICFGLSTLYSLGLSNDRDFNLLNKQILFSVLGFVLMFVISFFDYRWWRFLSIWLYFIAVFLLILVLFLGKTLGGTTGWFVLGDFSFQPVELAKLFVIIFLSRCFTKWVDEKYRVSLWLKSFFIILPVCLLILIQPDFGSMAVIFLIWILMLMLTGVKKKHILIFLLIILITAVFSWQFLLRDYQQDRILTFINPNADPLGAGYNVRQSMIAIGSGGLWGRGLGLGTQSQLRFLPISEADFIFASISEELGFVGALVIFILYFIFFFRLFKILRSLKDDFGLFLIFGLSAMFFIQVVINTGMCAGVLPVTGLPLPFVSYGGSFLIISLISIG
ncbi:rod shape-determining protein RodA, partial [Candidatus Parcubacteria bacterium]|nr:rod shape-determining protein RodA [Patescibacteria group bacterium]MCG2686829.1 rod shape-determining protein RodA [Candidatus Parcubacteria bacterium]